MTLKQLQQSLFFLIRKTLTIFIFMLKDINVDSVKWRLYLSSTTESALISLSFVLFSFYGVEPGWPAPYPPSEWTNPPWIWTISSVNSPAKISLFFYGVGSVSHFCFLVKMILLPINSAIHMKRSTDKQKKNGGEGGRGSWNLWS